eukprot:1193424-Prorocentrum_minimum.AAC.3
MGRYNIFRFIPVGIPHEGAHRLQPRAEGALERLPAGDLGRKPARRLGRQEVDDMRQKGVHHGVRLHRETRRPRLAAPGAGAAQHRRVAPAAHFAQHRHGLVGDERVRQAERVHQTRDERVRRPLQPPPLGRTLGGRLRGLARRLVVPSHSNESYHRLDRPGHVDAGPDGVLPAAGLDRVERRAPQQRGDGVHGLRRALLVVVGPQHLLRRVRSGRTAGRPPPPRARPASPAAYRVGVGPRCKINTTGRQKSEPYVCRAYRSVSRMVVPAEPSLVKPTLLVVFADTDPTKEASPIGASRLAKRSRSTSGGSSPAARHART